jgi:hypothetical protein
MGRMFQFSRALGVRPIFGSSSFYCSRCPACCRPHWRWLRRSRLPQDARPLPDRGRGQHKACDRATPVSSRHFSAARGGHYGSPVGNAGARARCRTSTRRSTRSRLGGTGASSRTLYLNLDGIFKERSWAGEVRNVSMLGAVPSIPTVRRGTSRPWHVARRVGADRMRDRLPPGAEKW